MATDQEPGKKSFRSLDEFREYYLPNRTERDRYLPSEGVSSGPSSQRGETERAQRLLDILEAGGVRHVG